MVAVGGHRIGSSVPDHVVDEHLPVHSHELQLCKDRGEDPLGDLRLALNIMILCNFFLS